MSKQNNSKQQKTIFKFKQSYPFKILVVLAFIAIGIAKPLLFISPFFYGAFALVQGFIFLFHYSKQLIITETHIKYIVLGIFMTHKATWKEITKAEAFVKVDTNYQNLIKSWPGRLPLVTWELAKKVKLPPTVLKLTIKKRKDSPLHINLLKVKNGEELFGLLKKKIKIV